MTRGWNSRIKIKHLLTEKEDHESIQKSMNDIADVLQKKTSFAGFDVSKFRKVPKGDEFFKPSDYANKMLSAMYDFADENRIWIE